MGCVLSTESDNQYKILDGKIDSKLQQAVDVTFQAALDMNPAITTQELDPTDWKGSQFYRDIISESGMRAVIRTRSSKKNDSYRHQITREIDLRIRELWSIKIESRQSTNDGNENEE